MKTSTIVNLSLVIICLICLSGFASSAEEIVDPSEASHTVIVLENVNPSVGEFGEDKDQVCSLETNVVNVDTCRYQLGVIGNTMTCFRPVQQICVAWARAQDRVAVNRVNKKIHRGGRKALMILELLLALR